MLNSECNGGREQAGTRTRDGKLWFPTQDGLAVIDPEALPHNPLPPSVVIETGNVRGRPVPLAGGWQLKPNEGSLEIRYTGLSLLKSDQVRFRYRLEGLDPAWVEAGTRRAAYYPYLPPGHYIFRVTACNSDLVWNEEGATLAIVVLPPFYQTWWFTGSMCAGVVGMASLVWKRRVGQLERAHAMQLAFSRQLIESQESEHKRMAAELHDSLGQHLLVIKNRAVLGTRSAGDQAAAKDQFDEITASASQAIDEVRQIAYNLRPLNLERLGVTVVIEELIEQVASASGIQFSADIMELDESLTPEDAINLYRIVQESVNNIVRHAHATKARVEIWSESGNLHVTVADNGQGFDVDSPARRGLGLTSISERVRMLGGVHTVFSKAGQGTTLTIRFPADRREKEKSNGV
jgi:signal transduction histidine kinase